MLDVSNDADNTADIQACISQSDVGIGFDTDGILASLAIDVIGPSLGDNKVVEGISDERIWTRTADEVLDVLSQEPNPEFASRNYLKRGQVRKIHSHAPSERAEIENINPITTDDYL